MSHYEERLEQDLNDIHVRIARVAGQVEAALGNAIHALLSGDDALAYATVLGDHPINRTVRDTDRRCHAFIALHLPGAGHLRMISSALRVNLELERVGDYAVTIAREAVRLSSVPKGALARELQLVNDEARRVLHMAVNAYNTANAEAARSTIVMADEVERSCSTILDGLAEGSCEGQELRDLFALFVIFSVLERVAGQAKNLCENAIFAATGESKASKRYQILFIDRDDRLLAPLAAAIGRRQFPNSGHYLSAGKEPAAEFDPALVAFLNEQGIDLSTRRPRRLELIDQELAQNHVIVSLDAPVRDYIPNVPFHTVALHWDVGEVPAGLDETQTRSRLEALYREIAVNVKDLMVTLRGEEAD